MTAASLSRARRADVPRIVELLAPDAPRSQRERDGSPLPAIRYTAIEASLPH